MEALRKRMKEFDFTESFTEKILKEYPLRKIEEKLELHAEGRQVRNPVGWLMAALRKDYGGKIEKEESPSRLKVDSQLDGNKKILPREDAIRWIRKIRMSCGRNSS